MTPVNARIPLTVTTLSPLHHGAGAAGNTALLRAQHLVLPDGRRAAVPFVSGNALRHVFRDTLAWHLARTLNIEPGGLSKAEVNLLWTGGALTKTGSHIELGLSRRALAAMPMLALLGYAAQSDIVAGALRVDNLNLVCAENQWRLPPHLVDHHAATVPAGAFRDDEFAVRHDVTNTPAGELAADDELFHADPSTRMIYERQTVIPGATLWGRLILDAAPPAAVDALDTALTLLLEHQTLTLGAKRAVGYGSCHVTLGDYTPDPDAVARHTEHTRRNADNVRDALRELTR